MLNTLLHQSSMQELDLLNPQLDPRISYTGGPKWYHGPDGLLRESRGNYLLHSNDFTNAVWSPPFNASVQAAAHVSNGVAMSKLVENTANAQHRVVQAYAAKAGTYTFQLKVKAAGRTNALVRIYEANLSRGAAYFDLTNGTVEHVPNGSATITALGDDVYLCTVTGTLLADGNLNAYINPTLPGSVASYQGDGVSGIYIAQAMVEKGSTANQYIHTTSAITYDWPLEYDPLTLALLGRSGWEQRTNLANFSEDIGSKTQFDTTVLSNVLTGPDGSQGMDKLVEAATNAPHYCAVTVSVVTGQAYTSSVYAKAGERGGLYVSLGGGMGASFNLLTGTANFTDGATAFWSAVEASVEDLGNGIYRCVSTATRLGANVSTTHRIGVASTPTFAGVQETYLGDGVSGVHIWGAQVEQAASAGPYIPTNSSQVTRPSELPMVEAIAEKLRFPGQSGTVVLEVRYPSSANKYTFAQIDDGDATLDDDWLFYTNNNFDHFVCRLYPGGAHTGVHIVTPNTNLRMVEAADAAGAITSVNGDTPTTGASGCSQVGMQRVIMGRASSGSGAAGAYIRYMAFYPSKFTAAEVQARAA